MAEPSFHGIREFLDSFDRRSFHPHQQSEAAQCHADAFNEDLDSNESERYPKRPRSTTTQSSRSTASAQSSSRSTTFDIPSRKGSVESTAFSAPSSRPRLPPDVVAHIGAPVPNAGVHRLSCEFALYSDCAQSFALNETEQWIEHSIAHLRDRLPIKCVCWFCDDFIFDASKHGRDRDTNFRDRMEHIRDHIGHDHYTIAEIRPDFHFLQHLHDNDLISAERFSSARRWNESPAPRRGDIHPYNFIPLERVQRDERAQQNVVMIRRERNRRDHTANRQNSNRDQQLRSRYFQS
ncbi:hypothetical protein BKA67DRAFT_532018 [Truncatella angustata]|uniref:Uncharacterized protein n=1 Tax=Truncatella angustata TaxID=152316 RepID=A0A9P9A139_9PEZI|nr:uncharacterized protein BKA67DRAFT_532018 [Truncatella angustata]KAH6656766.1 hypothetical protein BKA67DRAFT_532018 [Truncatella angustata]KAH8196313.1 hypothetical protein TruAng_009525 [Truncatella angustata]